MTRLSSRGRLLPEWHKKEKDFRDWYLCLVDNFMYNDRTHYFHYVEALKPLEKVRGYREIRYPKMEEARRKVRDLLHEPTTAVREPATV